MDRVQSFCWDKLCTMTGEEVAGHLTNYHGNQLLDEGFYKHLIDEGEIDDELDLYSYEDEEDEGDEEDDYPLEDY